MGLMRWMRGSDDDSSATAMLSAGLAEIDGLFRPSKHKQTEHVEETKRRRIDVANGADIDLEHGIAVVRAGTGDPGGGVARTPRTPQAARAAYQPPRLTWWRRMRITMRRRRRARALSAASADKP
jgi:hypothetical protein